MNGPAPRKVVASGHLGHWMDEVIRDAYAHGDFDHLPGYGKPLNLPDEDPFAGPEAMLYRILKANNVTPEWMTLRKQIVEQLNWLRANGKHPERATRIVETNVLIDKHNRSIPTPTLALPKVPRDFGLAPDNTEPRG